MDKTRTIADAELRQQNWKLFTAMTAWPLYLLVLPFIYDQMGLFAVVFMIFPGAYLYCWLGVLMHECSHNYFVGIKNRVCYTICSLMLCLDPQIFRLTHAAHHRSVNTYDDMQFHPIGRIRNRWLRIAYNWSEILLGDIHYWIFGMVGLATNPQYRHRYHLGKAVMWHLVWMLGLLAVGTLSHVVLGVGVGTVLTSYAIGIWLAGVVLRHNELVQHANLIVDGTRDERNRMTRNLRPDGLAARLFLFLTHDDPRHHVLHHTDAKVYSRPFPGHVEMPEDAVYITLTDYAKILWDMMLGRTQTIVIMTAGTPVSGMSQ